MVEHVLVYGHQSPDVPTRGKYQLNLTSTRPPPSTPIEALCEGFGKSSLPTYLGPPLPGFANTYRLPCHALP